MPYSSDRGIGLEARTGAVFQRTAWVWLSVLVWLVFGNGLALAQSSAPQIEIVQFGWQADGSLTPRGWNPVVVRASGASEPSARVQVTLELSVGSANQTFITPV